MHYDVAVIGAGIVGLAVGREVLQRWPRLRLVVLDKEPRIAAHQSSHNSGVIHSGLYYTPGSLKARLCVAGAAQLKRYCDEHGIPYRECGKVVVATSPEELPRLQALFERGQANGVRGLRLIGPEELREYAPHASGIRAIWSPVTGIVDYERVAHAYATDIVRAGGAIWLNHAVVGVSQRGGWTRLETTGNPVEARLVISCAGLYADRVARLSGGAPDPRIVPFRGDYYVLRPERRSLVPCNIYPVPDPRFPFLGVHFTPRMDGSVWLGPNAVLAFAREGYGRLTVRPNELLETLTYPGFQRLARRYWLTGALELWRDFSRRAFLRALQRYVPELTEDDLLPGPSGVRAQAMTRDGTLVDDFVIERQPGIVHIRNAPSPAATSSLTIAAYVADHIASEAEALVTAPV